MGRNEPTEEKRKQDDAALQIIFDYVVNNVYPEHACKNQKANIRKQSILRQKWTTLLQSTDTKEDNTMKIVSYFLM